MSTAPALGAVDYSELPEYAPGLGEVDYTYAPVVNAVEAAGAAGAHLSSAATAVGIYATRGAASASLVSAATAAGIYATRGAASAAVEALATAAVTSRPIRWIRPRQILLRPAMTATPMVKPQ